MHSHWNFFESTFLFLLEQHVLLNLHQVMTGLWRWHAVGVARHARLPPFSLQVTLLPFGSCCLPCSSGVQVTGTCTTPSTIPSSPAGLPHFLIWYLPWMSGGFRSPSFNDVGNSKGKQQVNTHRVGLCINLIKSVWWPGGLRAYFLFCSNVPAGCLARRNL